MLTPITAQITYNQFLIDNPTFWDDRIESGDIDEASVAYIQKWFGKRIVCDDFNFDTFFDRQLDLVLPRYNKLIRLENTEFDAMVNAYRERQITGTGSETLVGNTVTNKTDHTDDTGSVTTTEIPNLKDTNIVTNDLTDKIDKIRTPNLIDEQKGKEINSTTGAVDNTKEGTIHTVNDNDTSGVGKQNPQSISYQGATVGQVPALDWQYPSTQSQTHGHSVNDETYGYNGDEYKERTEYDDYQTEKSFDGRLTEHKGQDKWDNTVKKTGTVTTYDEKTGDDTKIEVRDKDLDTTSDIVSDKNDTKSTSDLIREIWTGRDNLTPQEALKSAMNYVKTSSAFAWLKDQLEVCFLSVYDI